MKLLAAARSLLAGLVAAGRASASMLIGYGNYPYDPLCAESCLRSFSSLMLDCSSMSTSMGSMMMMSTPASCFANSTPFLTSVAWCMYTKCEQEGVKVSKIEYLWEREITGPPFNNVPPKWSYSVALTHVDPQPPRRQVNSSDTDLNVTSIVNPSTYQRQWNTLGAVNNESLLESQYR